MKCDKCSADPDAKAKIFQRIQNSREYRNAESGQEQDQLFTPVSLFVNAVAQGALCVAVIAIAIYYGLKSLLVGAVAGMLASLFCYFFVQTVATIRAYLHSTPKPIAVIVVAKRTLKGRNRTHYATFEYECGRQEQILIWEVELFQKMEVNDAGVLIRRGPVAVGFRPVKK